MKKEDFFEVLGELDDNIVKGAENTMKKRINLKAWYGVAACFAVVVAAVAVIGMMHSNTQIDEKPFINLKPVINFEGIVTAVDNNKITLDDGKTIIITEDTEFMGDPDTGNAVNEDIVVGNFIQGYTKDSVDAAVLTAGKIWTNEGRTSGSEKRIINFEGCVAKAEQNSITLDDGRIVRFTENTTVTSSYDGSGTIKEGDYIQGYAENVESQDITAKYILITTL